MTSRQRQSKPNGDCSDHHIARRSSAPGYSGQQIRTLIRKNARQLFESTRAGIGAITTPMTNSFNDHYYGGSVYWRVPKFSTLPFRASPGIRIESRLFSALRNEWRLSMSYKPREDALYVALKHCGRRVSARFIIIVVDKHNRARNWCEGQQLFEGDSSDSHSLLRLSFISDPQNSMLDEDTLHIRCYVLRPDVPSWLLPNIPEQDRHIVVGERNEYYTPERKPFPLVFGSGTFPRNGRFQWRIGNVGVAIADAMPSFSLDLVGLVADYAREPRFLRSFGSHGQENGQLDQPQRICMWDDSEYVSHDSYSYYYYRREKAVSVVDKGGREQVFSADGRMQHVFCNASSPNVRTWWFCLQNATTSRQSIIVMHSAGGHSRLLAGREWTNVGFPIQDVLCINGDHTDSKNEQSLSMLVSDG